MSQTSYYHNGAWSGDASIAPYRALAFNEITRLIRTPNMPVVFRYLNNLLVTVSSSTITIDTGAALVGGVYVEHTVSSTLSLVPGSSDYPRIDRIVVRVLWDTQEVEIAYRQGESSPLPEPPTLTQDQGAVYEMSLARLYVPAGATTLTNARIIDEREFFEDAQHKALYATKNLLPNSELMLGVGTGASSLPSCWEVGALTPPSNITAMDKFDAQSRGTTAQMEFVTYHSDAAKCGCRITRTADMPITIRFLAHVTQGSVGVSLNGSTTALKTLEQTARPMEYIIRATITAAAPSLNMYWCRDNSTGDTAIIRIGQITVSYGYVGVGFLPKSEVILLNDNLPELHSAASVNSTTGTFEIIPADEITSGIDWNVKSLLLRLDSNDSNSSGAASSSVKLHSWTGSGGQMVNEMRGQAADSVVSSQDWIPYRREDGSMPKLKITTANDGGNTVDFTIYLLGVKT